MLSKKDKDKLVGLTFLGFLIAITFFFVFVHKKFNPIFVLGVLIVGYYFWIIPTFVNKYLKYKEYKVSFFHLLVPVYNEVCIFDGKVAIGALISSVLVIVNIGISFISPSLVYNVFGKNVAMSYAKYFLLFAGIFVLITTVLKGFGFSKIFREIYRDRNKIFNTHLSGPEAISIAVIGFILYIPILRAFGVIMVNSVLGTLVDFNKITSSAVCELDHTDVDYLDKFKED